MLIKTPQLGRRHFLVGGLASAGGFILPSGLRAQAPATRLALTPAQSSDPYYPTRLPADVDNDLLVLRGSAARAEGAVTHILGRVLGVDGKPVEQAQIEIWQCDVHGLYLHPGSGGLRDTAFQGFGRAISGADGSYRFRTIRPVPYTGRTPHIHFAVSTPNGHELVTQMYVAGEPQNERDFLYRNLGDRSGAVTVQLEAANGIEQGALPGNSKWLSSQGKVCGRLSWTRPSRPPTLLY